MAGQQIQFLSNSPSSPGGSHQTLSNLNFKPQNFISPILDHTGARKRVDFPSDVSYESKRRKSEKGGKGLRHFSMKVCEKVRTKVGFKYNNLFGILRVFTVLILFYRESQHITRSQTSWFKSLPHLESACPR